MSDVVFATESARLAARAAYLWMCAIPPKGVRNPLELVRLGLVFDRTFPPIQDEAADIRQLRDYVQLLLRQRNVLLPLARAGEWMLRQSYIDLARDELQDLCIELGLCTLNPDTGNALHTPEITEALEMLRSYDAPDN